MTYDDWKLRSDRDEYPGEEPSRCESCNHYDGYCDCPCCNDPDYETCPTCTGRGLDPWKFRTPCPTCGINGYVARAKK
jgi:hypothetical protein